MIRRILPLGGILAVALAAAPTALAAPDGTSCSLSAQQKLSKGLSATTAAPYSYTLTGTLNNCKSSSSAPASGTLAAGGTITIGGKAYIAPSPKASGDCKTDTEDAGSGHSFAFITWPDGTLTILDYTLRQRALAGDVLSGSVAASITLPLRDPDPLDPNHVSDVIRTTRFGGYSVAAALAAAPTDPTLCAGAGAKDWTLTGPIGFGVSS